MRHRVAPPGGLIVIIALAAMIGLAGCRSESSGNVHAFVKEVRVTEPGPIDPPPEVAEYKPYIYKARDRRSPFQLLQAEKQVPTPARSGVRPDPDRPRGPLEQYSLGALIMVGTIAAGGVDYALIRAPTGTIHRVTTGQYLGKHSGKVLQITPAGVVMREIVPRSTGGYRKKRTTITVGQ